MRATVVRNGSLAGELFIECSHKPDGIHESVLRYSVPVQAELPVGTVVDITCEVVGVPVVKLEPPQGDVTAVTAEPSVVDESPIVSEEEVHVQSEDNAAVS
jgi:hypothetical protein